MAGSFGYEAGHYDLSPSFADLATDATDENEAATVVAPGATRRSQVGDDGRSAHPVEQFADALSD